ncbi:MAG: biopolymer transport protein ExbB [Sulfurimonas sp.]|jgi:biopolymer transport protein ExbB
MNLMYYLDKGGFVMYVLLFLNIIGFTIIIYKFFHILYYSKNHHLITQEIKNELEKTNVQNSAKFMIITLLKDALSFRMQKLTYGLNTVKIIASISPLIGLFGTALGVFHSFEAIASLGLSDPTIFAKGISIALITTLGGLIVAIPHYIAYNYLIGLVDNLEAFLDSKLVPITVEVLK